MFRLSDLLISKDHLGQLCLSVNWHCSWPLYLVLSKMTSGFFFFFFLLVVLRTVVFFIALWLFLSQTITMRPPSFPLAYRRCRDNPCIAFLVIHVLDCFISNVWVFLKKILPLFLFASSCPPNYKLDYVVEFQCIFFSCLRIFKTR